MDIQAMLAAAASVAKPEPYPLPGGGTLYVRRFTCDQPKKFLATVAEKAEKKQTLTKAWVIAFGLCNERNEPIYPNPDEGEAVMDGLLVEDQIALEELVMKKLGMPIDKAKKD